MMPMSAASRVAAPRRSENTSPDCDTILSSASGSPWISRMSPALRVASGSGVRVLPLALMIRVTIAAPSPAA